jgi:hypothetical protein
MAMIVPRRSVDLGHGKQNAPRVLGNIVGRR